MGEYRNPYSSPNASQILLYGMPQKERTDFLPKSGAFSRRIQTPFVAIAANGWMGRDKPRGDRGTRWV